jgi:hypothetical protein
MRKGRAYMTVSDLSVVPRGGVLWVQGVQFKVLRRMSKTNRVYVERIGK